MFCNDAMPAHVQDGLRMYFIKSVKVAGVGRVPLGLGRGS